MLARMSERVLITGGEGGLAKALADAFRATGDDVLAPGRGELDVSEPASVEQYLKEAASFDLLIANAGCAENELLARCSEASWDRQMEVNLHGAFRCARGSLRGMLKKRRGHIILISSYSAVHPPAGQAAYAAAKAGLIGLGKSLAQEVGGAGIRVNVVLPGFLETRMTDKLSEQRKSEVLSEHSLGRFNTPEAAANFICHLHHELPHTSGQVFQLDSR